MSARRTALLATLAAAVLIAATVLLFDRAVSSWAHGLGRPVWAVRLTHLADLPQPLAALVLIVAAGAWLAGWRPGPSAAIVLRAAIATLLAIALKDALKFGFGRTWPETWVDHNPSWITDHVFGFLPFHGGRGYASFPSGHTTQITTPCASLWPFRRARPVLVLLPLLVVAGLIGSDFHWLGDCVAGAFLAVACAAFIAGWRPDRA